MATILHLRFYKLCLFGLWKSLVISAFSLINAYSDAHCKDFLDNVQTKLVAADGDCIALPKGTHSVKTVTVDNGCGGVYKLLSEDLITRDACKMYYTDEVQSLHIRITVGTAVIPMRHWRHRRRVHLCQKCSH